MSSPARPNPFGPEWEESYANPTPEFVQAAFRTVPSTIAALAALIDGSPVVMIVSSFTVGASHSPPMCMFAAQNSSSTWPRLKQAPRIGVSLLGTSHQQAIRALGSRDAENRLNAVEWTELPSGAVTLYDAPLWLECDIAHEYPAGDHQIVVLEVRGSSIAGEHQSLIHQNTPSH